MSFKDILGQDKPIEILKTYLQQGHLQGGFLFVGPEGIGKKTIAKTLAKTLNCDEEGNDACDKCPSCLKIEKNQHPDFYIIDPDFPVDPDLESDDREAADTDAVKIKHIRQLQREIALRPYEARKKVFIIDNAHNLTAVASNALLKILEEPPRNSLIILITDKPGLLFKTIISRCKILKFLPLPRSGLKEILQKEYRLDNDTAHFLAYFSEGRFGRALSLKDTDIFRDKNNVIDKFFRAGRPDLEGISAQKREEVRGYLNILATWFRDIYLIKVGSPLSETINFDRQEALLKAAQRFTFLDLNTALGGISDALLRLGQNINVKLLLYNLGAQIWKG